ncbi:universal stress protein [Desulforhopalus sp. 52FAK]
MKKHFLATVSNDYDQLTGLEFVCSFFKKLSEHQVTLLHICRLDAGNPNKALLEMWEHPDERISGKPTVGAQKALNKATQMLSQSKMSVDSMVTKTFAERFGKIKDILNESSTGLYDAIILGKRASYTLQWFFERPADETAKAIIKDSSLATPIWICPEPEPGRSNVLVCVDGSDESFRAVDHVGYILSLQDQHNITLLMVDNGSGLNSDVIFQKAIKILTEHSITSERCRVETTWGLNIAGTITSYAEKNNYAAIAVGLHGVNEGFMKRISLAGGTTSSLIERAEKVAIWCCP